MHKVLIHLNQFAIQNLCDINYMRAYVKIDTKLSFADLHFQSKPFLSVQFENQVSLKIYSLQGIKQKKSKQLQMKNMTIFIGIFLENTERLVLATLKHMTKLELMVS